MTNGRTYLSIGDVLTLLRQEFPDVTISKIRFLESQGLVNPERTPSGYRKFYEHDVERLRWVLRQQREHFLPLKVIKGRLEDEVGVGVGVGAGSSDVAGAGAGGGGGAGGRATLGGGVSGASVGRGLHSRPGNGQMGSEADKTGRGSGSHRATGTELEEFDELAELDDQVPGQLPGFDIPATADLRSGGPSAASGRTEKLGVGAARPASSAALRAPSVSSGRPPATSPGRRVHVPGRSPTASEPQTVAPRSAAAAATAGSGSGSASTAGGASGAPGGARSGSTGGGVGRHSAPTPGSQRVGTSAEQGPEPEARNTDSRNTDSRNTDSRNTDSRNTDSRNTDARRTASDSAVIGSAEQSSHNAEAAFAGGSRRLTTAELATAAGLPESMITDLQSYGILEGKLVGGVLHYDDLELAVARLAAEFGQFGIEPRHLRLYKHAAERESGFVEQLVLPLLKQRNPEARQRAADMVSDLTRLGQGLRAALVTRSLQDLLGG